MDEAGYARVKEIFLRVIELEKEERTQFLDQECGQDRELRQEVESLLNYHLNRDEPGLRS